MTDLSRAAARPASVRAAGPSADARLVKTNATAGTRIVQPKSRIGLDILGGSVRMSAPWPSGTNQSCGRSPRSRPPQGSAATAGRRPSDGRSSMKVRLFAAAAVVATLAVAASTRVRAHAHQRPRRGEQDHRLAAGRRAVGLAEPRGRGQPGVRDQAPRGERRRAVPDLGRPPEQVRRHARGRQHARRHRDGQHRDDEVHGGGRVREPELAEGLVRELEELAQGPRSLGDLQRQDLRRPVLRGLARRHVPDRPVPEGARQGADQPRGVHGDGQEAHASRTTRRASRRSTSRAPTGTSR